MLMDLLEAGPALEQVIARHRDSLDEGLLIMLHSRIEAAQRLPPPATPPPKPRPPPQKCRVFSFSNPVTFIFPPPAPQAGGHPNSIWTSEIISINVILQAACA